MLKFVIFGPAALIGTAGNIFTYLIFNQKFYHIVKNKFLRAAGGLWGTLLAENFVLQVNVSTIPWNF